MLACQQRGSRNVARRESGFDTEKGSVGREQRSDTGQGIQLRRTCSAHSWKATMFFSISVLL